GPSKNASELINSNNDDDDGTTSFVVYEFCFSVFLQVDRKVCEWGGYINGHILDNLDFQIVCSSCFMSYNCACDQWISKLMKCIWERRVHSLEARQGNPD
ncbi:hypothetical protein Q9233_010114, partial [Columba guinea]